jgi:hypothetical protein
MHDSQQQMAADKSTQSFHKMRKLRPDSLVKLQASVSIPETQARVADSKSYTTHYTQRELMPEDAIASKLQPPALSPKMFKTLFLKT